MTGQHHRVSALVSSGWLHYQCCLLQTVRLLHDSLTRDCQHQCIRVVVIRWSVIVRTTGILLPHHVTSGKLLTIYYLIRTPYLIINQSQLVSPNLVASLRCLELVFAFTVQTLSLIHI